METELGPASSGEVVEEKVKRPWTKQERPPSPLLVDRREALQLLGVQDPATLYRLSKDGEVVSLVVGQKSRRWTRSSILAYIDRQVEANRLGATA